MIGGLEKPTHHVQNIVILINTFKIGNNISITYSKDNSNIISTTWISVILI